MASKKPVKQESEVSKDLHENYDFSLTLRVTQSTTSGGKVKKRVRVRVVSEWISCCLTTEVFGEGSLAWDDGLDSSKKTASFTSRCNIDLSSEQKIINFIAKPWVYAILMTEDSNVEDDPSVLPVFPLPYMFAVVDCRQFLLSRTNSGSGYAADKQGGVSMDLTITCKKPLIPLEKLLRFQPLVIHIDRVLACPLVGDQTIDDACGEVYIYGRLDFGNGHSSVVACQMCPQALKRKESSNADAEIDGATGDDESEAEIDMATTFTNAVQYSICLLPTACGMYSLDQFKEHSSASTFTLEIHSDNVRARAFSKKNVDIFFESLGTSRPQSSQQTAAAQPAAVPAPTKKGASKNIPVVSTKTLPTFFKWSGTGSECNSQDKLLAEMIQSALGVTSHISPHGVVHFRLESLLNSSVDLIEQFSRNRKDWSANEHMVLCEHLDIDVVPCKPTRPEPWAVPPQISLRTELATRKSVMEESRSLLVDANVMSTAGTSQSITDIGSGAAAMKTGYVKPRHELFLEYGTIARVVIELHRVFEPPQPLSSLASSSQLESVLKQTPFARMVFTFPYADSARLRDIQKAIERVNKAALPNIQGSLRSYNLSVCERDSADKGVLDIVTGFTLIDDDKRIIVIEGLAGLGKGMQSVFADLPRLKPNDSSEKFLCNPEILFPERLYTAFGTDLKRIHLREKLKRMAQRPEIYDRLQSDILTFEAVEKLMELKRATDMRSTKLFTLYPCFQALEKLELLYGEAVSREDMDGVDGGTMRASGGDRQTVGSVFNAAGPGDDSDIAGVTARRRIYDDDHNRKQGDYRNPEFEEYLRTRPEHRVDFLAEQRALRMKAWEDMLGHRTESNATSLKMANTLYEGDKKVHVYSTQSINYKSLAFDQMRRQLSTVKNAIFTFNREFNSQTVSAVDPKKEAAMMFGSSVEDKTLWLTQSGFKYPKARTSQDLIRHPKRPGNSTIEDLKSPWEEPAQRLPGITYPDKNNGKSQQLLQAEQGFSSRVPNKLSDFGGLTELEYEHDFRLKHIGDKKTLPRGKILKGQDKNPDFFRSVHIGGVEAARLLEEAVTQEKEEWKKRVVVDHTDFKVGGFSVRDSPATQISRYEDILKGDAKTNALRSLRDMKNNSGRDISYRTLPIQITNVGPYVPDAGEKALLRDVKEHLFVTAKETCAGGRPRDFTRHINKDAAASSLIRSVYPRLKHKSLHESDKSGPKWDHV